MSVCPCVTDVGLAVTDLRVVCKIITCVSAFTFEIMAINVCPCVMDVGVACLSVSANQTLALKVHEVMGYALELEVC